MAPTGAQSTPAAPILPSAPPQPAPALPSIAASQAAAAAAPALTPAPTVAPATPTPAPSQFGRAAVFYVSGRVSTPEAIWHLDLSTRATWPVVTGQTGTFEVHDLTASPRGSGLAFTFLVRLAPMTVGLASSSVVLLPVKSSQAITVAATTGYQEEVDDPRWSPDGTRLGYKHVVIGEGGAPSQVQLRVYQLRSGQTQTVTQSGGASFDWSPGGTAMVVAKPGVRSELDTLALSSGQLSSLWESDVLVFEAVAWQPAEDQVAVAVSSQGGSDPEQEGLYLVNIATKERRELADGRIDGLAWAPDGKKLVYRRTVNRISRIWLYDTASGLSTMLLDQDAAPPTSSTWSPRGDALLLAVHDSSRQAYWISIFRLNGSGLSKLVSVDSLDPEPVW